MLTQVMNHLPHERIGNEPACDSITEYYHLNANGLKLTIELSNPSNDDVFLRIPLLHSNGKDTTDDKTVICSKEKYGNRNGEYYLALLVGKGNRLAVHMSFK